MARRKSAAVEVAPDIPPYLAEPPHSPEGIASWIASYEEPPEGWGFGDAMWRQIQAHVRFNGARRAWCTERGLSYAETFRPRKTPGGVGIERQIDHGGVGNG